MNDKVLNFIGLSMRAGKVIFGGNLVTSAIRSRSKPDLVLLASDASENTCKRIVDSCDFHRVVLVKTEYDGATLAATIGKQSDVMVIAIADKGLANTIFKHLGVSQGNSNEEKSF